MSIKQDYKPDSTWKARRRVRYHGLLVITLALIGLFGSLLAYIGRYKAGHEDSTLSASRASQASPAKLVARTQPDAPLVVKPKYDFYNVLPHRKVEISGDEFTHRRIRQESPPSGPTDKADTANDSKPSATGPSLSTVKTKVQVPSEGRAGPVMMPTSVKSADSAENLRNRTDQPVGASKSSVGYFLQVGSFRNHSEADRRKAAVAFMGISARIEQGTGTDGGTLHRVRIGPFKDYAQLQALRERLESSNIPAIAVKVN